MWYKKNSNSGGSGHSHTNLSLLEQIDQSLFTESSPSFSDIFFKYNQVTIEDNTEIDLELSDDSVLSVKIKYVMVSGSRFQRGLIRTIQDKTNVSFDREFTSQPSPIPNVFFSTFIDDEKVYLKIKAINSGAQIKFKYRITEKIQNVI